ncbi:LysR family transcriptional regulator [Pseudaestuariivita atlantica]|uniref:LysR family transcriptional regulator n=1 Tax=Pseudaestuariivita atlantica TaxID=1317121 RepID=A0A0L1JNQ7_9RHOB|nr:LysR family transcriptional regulator [Pseudaestuariivita atlantica]KNG93391.1 LysR family transcriptional regulator [Pseudaestuariivita atlantica]
MDARVSDLNWSLVQTFLAVAETGSLSAAARALGASQPTVGRQIRQIEEQTGLTLFQRQSRGLSLTPAGETLMKPARAMQVAMRDIALAAGGQSDRLEGTVRITASIFTALHHLPQIIARIREEAPGIAVELVPTDTSENLLFREADIAVRMYRTEQLDIITQHMGELQIGIFATRSYLDRVGMPETMDDLREMDLVGYDKNERIIRGMRDMGWPATRDWFATRCDMHPVYWELVRAGCGVGFAQVDVGQRDPEMVHLFPDIPIAGLPVWLAAHEGMRRTPRIRLVWDMLAEGLKPVLSGG